MEVVTRLTYRDGDVIHLFANERLDPTTPGYQRPIRVEQITLAQANRDAQKEAKNDNKKH